MKKSAKHSNRKKTSTLRAKAKRIRNPLGKPMTPANVKKSMDMEISAATAQLTGLLIWDGPTPAPPAGYGVISIDLNDGAGGNFLYLCSRYGTANGITEIKFYDGGINTTPQVPSGFTIVNDQDGVPCNVNRGTNGRHIWMGRKRNPDDNYITGLWLRSREDNDPGTPPSGYTRIPVDLNGGAGGQYIWLYYKKT